MRRLVGSEVDYLRTYIIFIQDLSKEDSSTPHRALSACLHLLSLLPLVSIQSCMYVCMCVCMYGFIPQIERNVTFHIISSSSGHHLSVRRRIEEEEESKEETPVHQKDAMLQSKEVSNIPKRCSLIVREVFVRYPTSRYVMYLLFYNFLIQTGDGIRMCFGIERIIGHLGHSSSRLGPTSARPALSGSPLRPARFCVPVPELSP